MMQFKPLRLQNWHFYFKFPINRSKNGKRGCRNKTGIPNQNYLQKGTDDCFPTILLHLH